MATVLILLSLFSLLPITDGNHVNCSTEIKGIPPDFTKINGLWNIQLILSLEDIKFKDKGVAYIFSRVSANEKEANISVSYNPLSIEGGEVTCKRIGHGDSGDLSYEFTFLNGTKSVITIVQPHPGSLIIYYRENGVYKLAVLYYKETSLPPNEVEHFSKWSQCKNLHPTFDLDTSINYAEQCSGLLEKSDDLDDVQHAVFLNLVAKSVSSEDFFSRFKMLYTARLEILHLDGKYTVREYKKKTVEYKEAEYNYIKGSKTDDIKISTFKTEKDLLLLGVRKGSSRTLYLASKTFKAEEHVLDKFLIQATCFGNRYTYFVPGTRERDHGVSCFGDPEDVTPLPVNKSLGRWNLAISVQRLRQSLLHDVANIHGATELREEGGKYLLTQVTVGTTLPFLRKDILMELKDGYLSLPGSNKPLLRYFSRDCVFHVSEDQDDALYLFCHSNILSFEDRILFLQYAVCQNYTNMVIRRRSALSCLNIPAEVKQIDRERLSGKWKVETSATYKKVKVPTEMDFTVQDQQVIVSQEDGTKITMEKSDNKFQDIGDKEHFLVFHQSIGDSLLVWSERKTNDITALYLISKSNKVDPAEVEVFKEFASCLSFTDIHVYK